MPTTISETFRYEKNRSANAPIILYEITVSPGNLLYLCEWDTTIVFGGITYYPFPLSHEGIATNALGQIDSVRVKLSSVDRTIIATLAANNGLIGCQVVMKLVFLDRLDDPNAYVSSTFFVDSVETDEHNAVFILTSKLDLYKVYIPGRMFERNHCQWTYKQEGCWLWGGGILNVWVAPSGFLNEEIECDHTRSGDAGCIYHNNSGRFGGFPAIPQRGIYIV